MRSRKPRNSDDLPNGFHSNEVKERQHRNCHTVLKVVAFALALTWASSVYVNSASSSMDSSKGWGLRNFWHSSTSDDSNHAKHLKSQPESKRHRKHHSSRHDKNKRKTSQQPDEMPECTPSPLEEERVYPMYACKEIKVSLMTSGIVSFLSPVKFGRRERRVCFFSQQLVLRLFCSCGFRNDTLYLSYTAFITHAYGRIPKL